jgi:sirohydrochlorin ferrochelatase
VTLVLVAHGTRDPAGVRVVDELADRVRCRLPGVPVKVAFADVCGPTVDSVLRSLDGPAVVVPAFLASGYHVRTDLPAQVAGRAVITPPLGPAPALIAAMHDRLRAAGWRPGDTVVLAAAGSSDPRAGADVRRAAILLGLRLGAPVRIGYVATVSPRITDVLASVRRRVAVASWLLAPGAFHRVVAGAGADVVSEPIGAHPRVAELIASRYAGIIARSTTLT